jgi:NAD(P)H-hydrate epimerase
MKSSHALYSVAQVRAFDAHAINVLGVPGYALMQRAGEASLNALRSRWPTALHIAIVCGGGNNGGDGYVLARYARAAGLAVSLFAVVDPALLKGDARRAADDFLAGGGHAQPFSAAALGSAEVLVDALLGTGARAPLAPEMLSVIGAMNRSGLPILALDLPSGLDGDRGIAQGDAVRADTTITFVAPKCGLYLGSGPEYAGRVLCDSLEVTLPDGKAGEPMLERIEESELARALPRRNRIANKGDFGRVLVIAGARGMAGAARLAGEAALRCGAGLVTVATAQENVAAIVGGRPELICFGANSANDLEKALVSCTVVAVGPGLGTDAWSRALLDAALGSGKSLVIDADGLNMIAAAALKVPASAILTPHPGEAARLLGCSTSEVQADRTVALRRLVEKFGAVIVLKGAGTLVGAPGRTSALCTRGNPGMAAPGMGDVLTGAIAALLAQCRDPLLAAHAGVIAHALAGDDLARQGGGRGMLALELAEGLTRWVNP